MQLKRLALTQVRVFEQAEFEFQPGMNLLVGVNGAGKSTVLDALRVMLSKALPKLTSARSVSIHLGVDDITVGHDWLYTVVQFDMNGVELEYEIREWREKIGAIDVKKGDVRQQIDDRRDVHRLRHREKLPKDLKNNPEQPLAIFFSTHRSLLDTRQSKASGQAAAFANALIDNRGLRLREFAEWWLVQEALANEVSDGPFAHRLDVLNDAVASFLDDCANLRAVREPETTLMIDKDGTPLDIRQLSDGERGMVALVFDLARRLAQANPKLENPLRDGKAVVLIDELDLHLHPSWQRTIAQRLTTTFPNCQFIATTHSPQVIGEVSPENIILIEDGKTYRPNQSFGMDSNWIVQYLMGGSERNTVIDQRLDYIGDLIEDEKFEQAAVEINQLRDQIGDFFELVRLQTRLDRMRIIGI